MKRLYWIAFLGALAGFCSAQSGPAFVPQSIRGKDGFFRVGKTTAGYWWLMTPEGQPFYHIGVCAANRAGTAGGRRAQPGEYALTIDRKYQYQDGSAAFANSVNQRLTDWRFNTLGAWTVDDLHETGMPYTDIIEFSAKKYRNIINAITGEPINPNNIALSKNDALWLRAEN